MFLCLVTWDFIFTGYVQAQCATYRMPYELVYGTHYNESNWIGIDKSVQQINNIIYQLENVLPRATDQVWGAKQTAWMNVLPEKVEDGLDDYYDEFKLK